MLILLEFIQINLVAQRGKVVEIRKLKSEGVPTVSLADLFHVSRQNIQAIIDRRFYRRKYDAARILEAFSTSLRHEVDLNQLNEQLVEIVQETMQPTYVSLWLRSRSRDEMHNTQV